MHDTSPESLRKQALKHKGKTMSRKAQAKQDSLMPSRLNSTTNSAVNSRNVSRAGSRANSHAGSDDEGGDSSDGLTSSVNSIDKLLTAEDPEESPRTWEEDLQSVIEELLDRNWKRSNKESRERALAAYVRLLMAQFAQEEIATQTEQLVSAFVKSIKAEDSSREVTLALKALSITMVTSPSGSIYEESLSAVKNAITDSETILVKTEAIHAFGTLAFFGDLSDDELLDGLSFLLEVVSSDGEYISAPDAPEPVVAALEEWGVLATLIDDLSAESEDMVEVFFDQLSSSSVSVAIAAGENIALLYEKAYTEPEPGEVFSESDEENVVREGDSSTTHGDDSEPLSDRRNRRPLYVRRYTVYRRHDRLEGQLKFLAGAHGRAISRAARRELHASFHDIHSSVRDPTRGPRYSTAIDAGTGAEYGSRIKLKAGGSGGGGSAGVAKLDKWWQLVRLNALKRILQGGLAVHWQRNGVVFESVPIVFVAVPPANIAGTGVGASPGLKKPRKGRKGLEAI